ncbi:MAG: hypothetical protein OES15_06725 [Nitrosopumilus sp.]|nr:hypothetical protein [Nitrosopumilus sp.]
MDFLPQCPQYGKQYFFLIVINVWSFLPSKGLVDCTFPSPTCSSTPIMAITIVSCIGSSRNIPMNQILENYSERNFR